MLKEEAVQDMTKTVEELKEIQKAEIETIRARESETEKKNEILVSDLRNSLLSLEKKEKQLFEEHVRDISNSFHLFSLTSSGNHFTRQK